MRKTLLTRTLQNAFRLQWKRFLRLVRLGRKGNLRVRIEAVCVFLFFGALFVRIVFHDRFSHPQTTGITSYSSVVTHSTQFSTDSKEIAKREASLIEAYVCAHDAVDDNVEELRLCGKFPPSESKKKIVGLVEVRNAERSLHSFLSALSRVVDSIVVIDDHSSDGSRNEVLQFNSRHSRTLENHRLGGIEILLRKSGVWSREELRDRELLLSAARKVGGTHFVLLDYDEYISANCVDNGLLRRSILHLLPGESIYLPWVEAWKSIALQRVLRNDRNMNFLTRRQVVIFADDGKFNYTMGSSIARRLGSSTSQNSTIHALRCPRSICPQPSRYRGPHSDIGYPSSVKRLEICRIVEVRFLNVNNVLLKSAWYEALGRVMGADDTVTRGKMVDALFPRHNFSRPAFLSRKTSNTREVTLSSTRPEWLQGYPEFAPEYYNRIELWRAEEMLTWIERHGISFFSDLEALSRIDIQALQSAVLSVRQKGDMSLLHVPRLKSASIVVAIELSSARLASSFLSHLGWREVKLRNGANSFTQGIRLSNTTDQLLSYERWKFDVQDRIHSAMDLSASNSVFVSTADTQTHYQLSLIELLRNEFSHLHVTILVANWTQGMDSESFSISSPLFSFATEAGSHVRVLDVPLQSFGSYATLYWLRQRLAQTNAVSSSASDDAALLEFTEGLHRSMGKLIPSLALVPVARVVFSLNVGRSGSKYLADILGTVSNPILAVHEPRCDDGLCSGGGAVRMQNQSLLSSYVLRRGSKLPMIRSSVAAIPGTSRKTKSVSRTFDCSAVISQVKGQEFLLSDQESFRPILEVSSISGCSVHVMRDIVYAETNPNFKSWFYDVVLDNLPESGYSVVVVVLRKFIAAVVKSLYETGYFTSRDGYNWMETSAGVNSNLRAERLADDTKLDAYEKLTSYILNSEATFRHIMESYGNNGSRPLPSVQYLESRSEQIFSKEGALQLLQSLRLRSSEETMRHVGVVADKYLRGRTRRKKKHLKTSLGECERRIRQLVEEVAVFNPEVESYVKAMKRVKGFEYAH